MKSYNITLTVHVDDDIDLRVVCVDIADNNNPNSEIMLEEWDLEGLNRSADLKNFLQANIDFLEVKEWKKYMLIRTFKIRWK